MERRLARVSGPVAGGVALAVAGAAALGWWETGERPFSTTAYVILGVVVALVVAAFAATGGLSWRARREVDHAYRTAAGGAGWRQSAPWPVLIAAAVVLEAVGLAFGGRSHAVPTLSDVVDRALAWHAVRVVLFVAWLAVGTAPVVRLRRRRHVVGPGRGGP